MCLTIDNENKIKLLDRYIRYMDPEGNLSFYKVYRITDPTGRITHYQSSTLGVIAPYQKSDVCPNKDGMVVSNRGSKYATNLTHNEIQSGEVSLGIHVYTRRPSRVALSEIDIAFKVKGNIKDLVAVGDSIRGDVVFTQIKVNAASIRRTADKKRKELTDKSFPSKAVKPKTSKVKKTTKRK